MSRRILLVEDEEGLRVTLSALLELDDFEVLEAANGAIALELLESEEVDLVLSDIRMPKLGGVDLLQGIKQLYPRLPVLLMTAFSSDEQTRAAIEAGAYAVLPKPFDVEATVPTLERAMDRPTVLVVDDQLQDMEELVEALERAGLDVHAVAGGRLAIDAVDRGHIDVVVTDIRMPGIDGVEVIRQIHGRHPAVILIAISGFSVPEMLRQVADSGVFVYMRKPLDPLEVMTMIARARSRPLAGEIKSA